jgi:HNH/ENDO VII superfamily nuclease
VQAHHLIPANVWENRLVLATLAGQAGWQPDSEKNLIALPANEAAQAELAASMEGRIRAGEWMPKLR